WRFTRVVQQWASRVPPASRPSQFSRPDAATAPLTCVPDDRAEPATPARIFLPALRKPVAAPPFQVLPRTRSCSWLVPRYRSRFAIIGPNLVFLFHRAADTPIHADAVQSHLQVQYDGQH